MIEAHNLTLARGGRTVLTEVSLVAHDAQILGIVGPNGSGKTSLLMALWQALTPLSGSVLVDGLDLSKMSRRDIAAQISVVQQDQEPALPLPVRDSIALGRLASKSLRGYGDDTDQAIIEQALHQTNLTGLANRLMTQLSGGEQQRVLIARAITQQTPHLLLDEPTNHLDVRHQFALMRLIRDLGRTTVVVLHDLNLAARFCDQVALLSDGRLVATGAPEEVLHPNQLMPIYQVNIEVFEHRGRQHLVFDPDF